MSQITKKIAYILVANKPLRYERGSSRIAYIGRTSNGVSRIAQSAAKKIEDTLDCPGVRRLRAFVVWSEPRPYERANLPHLLERGLLLQFREKHAEVPRFNTQSHAMSWKTELVYFRKEALKRVIERYS